MKELDHPNICKLLETYEQGRFMFFVMEYCAGKEVFDRIMDVGLIEEVSTAKIIQQTASALLYAHTNGIAHRDIKPENIVFCNDDADCDLIKVIDWGLGFFFGQGRMSSAVGSLTYAAPEVLQAKAGKIYTSACDVWSLAVMTYVMLSGKPPFWGNQMQQLQSMKKMIYPLSDGTWKSTSAEAKDFIRKLLISDPRTRPTMDQALAHPWLRGAAQNQDGSGTVSQQVLSNLRQFNNTSKFVSICVAAVARQLDHTSLRDVHRVFSELDTNNDGVLELEEVRTGFHKMCGADAPEIQEITDIFNSMDLDGNGKIDYTEFCAAGIGERSIMEEEVLWAAFKAFDVEEDDGKLTKTEIMKVLSDTDVNQVWTKEVCDEAFQQFDKNSDGKIDFEEWLDFMRTVASSCKVKEGSAQAKSQKERKLLGRLATTQFEVAKSTQGFEQAMSILHELDGPPRMKPEMSRGISQSMRSIGFMACWSERADAKKEPKNNCVVQ